jgi:hypothetical protein
MLAQCVHFGFRIGEVSCPTKYFDDASSINFRPSVKHGMGVLGTTLQFAVQRFGLGHFRIFSANGRRLEPGYAEYYARGGAVELQAQLNRVDVSGRNVEPQRLKPNLILAIYGMLSRLRKNSSFSPQGLKPASF